MVESTGLFLTKREIAGSHRRRRQVCGYPSPPRDDTPMFVCGVNQNTYVKGTQFVIERILHHKLSRTDRQKSSTINSVS